MIFRNKKAIICDMDGTLIDSIPVWNKVDSEIITSFGKIPSVSLGIDRTKFLERCHKGDIYMQYAQYLIDTYELDGTNASTINNMRTELSKDYHENHMDFKEGADEFLIKAKEKKYMLLLASSTSRRIVDIYSRINRKMMQKVKLDEIFDHIITKENVYSKKPNPEVYLLATKLSGLSPNRLIAIEDELVGVKAAVQAGIQVVSMYDEYSNIDRDFINALADYSVKDYQTLIKKL